MRQTGCRPTAGNKGNALDLGQIAEMTHDVMAEKIGEQYQQIGIPRQSVGFALVGCMTPGDMLRDADIPVGKQLGNISQAVCTY